MRFLKYFIFISLFFSKLGQALPPEEELKEQQNPIKKISQTELQRKTENGMLNHLYYMAGAYSGALTGSFFVHFFDSIATRQFANTGGSIGKFFKSTLKSYLPVGLWVVPARSISFGFFSISQGMLEKVGFSYEQKVIFSSLISGLSLAVLSTPAELLKTRQQLAYDSKITFFEVQKNFAPLAMRVIPTVSMMLAGTQFIQSFIPFENLIISTSSAAILSAGISHIFATPSENIRIFRVQNNDYSTSTASVFKKIFQDNRLYKGYFARALSLGIQASFTMSAANSMSNHLNNEAYK
jgi:hypothetical protein